MKKCLVVCYSWSNGNKNGRKLAAATNADIVDTASL